MAYILPRAFRRRLTTRNVLSGLALLCVLGLVVLDHMHGAEDPTAIAVAHNLLPVYGGDIDVRSDQVARAIREAGDGSAIISAQRLAGGVINAVFRVKTVNRHVLLKFGNPFWTTCGKLGMEATVMRYVAANSQVPVPDVYFLRNEPTSASGPDRPALPPFMVTQFVDGGRKFDDIVRATPPGERAQVRKQLVRAFAEVCHEMRDPRMRFDSLGSFQPQPPLAVGPVIGNAGCTASCAPNGCTSYGEFVAGLVEGFLPLVPHVLPDPEPLLERLRCLAGRFRRYRPPDAPLTIGLVHHDLSLRNVLFGKESDTWRCGCGMRSGGGPPGLRSSWCRRVSSWLHSLGMGVFAFMLPQPFRLGRGGVPVPACRPASLMCRGFPPFTGSHPSWTGNLPWQPPWRWSISLITSSKGSRRTSALSSSRPCATEKACIPFRRCLPSAATTSKRTSCSSSCATPTCGGISPTWICSCSAERPWCNCAFSSTPTFASHNPRPALSPATILPWPRGCGVTPTPGASTQLLLALV